MKEKPSGLTEYESEQITEISVWLSEPTNPLSELWRLAVTPAAKSVEVNLPDGLVKMAIEKCYDASEMLAGRNEIRDHAGVKSFGDLRARPLEECDQLAKHVGMVAQALATAEAAAAGESGDDTPETDIPILFTVAIGTVLKIGHCYGYALNHHKDRAFVLNVLATACSEFLETRRQSLGQRHEIEDPALDEARVEQLAQEVLTLLFRLEALEEIPGVGAVSEGLLDLVFLNRVDISARRIFQERWLRDRGKVGEIALQESPASDLSTPELPTSELSAPVLSTPELPSGWREAIPRAAYSGCYGLGFGVAFPVCFMTILCRPVVVGLGENIRHGSFTVTDAARSMMKRARDAVVKRQPVRLYKPSPEAA